MLTKDRRKLITAAAVSALHGGTPKFGKEEAPNMLHMLHMENIPKKRKICPSLHANFSVMRTIPKENIYVSTHANVKSDELWNWKLFSLNSLVEEKYFFL
jgi:hypothetical protein